MRARVLEYPGLLYAGDGIEERTLNRHIIQFMQSLDVDELYYLDKYIDRHGESLPRATEVRYWTLDDAELHWDREAQLLYFFKQLRCWFRIEKECSKLKKAYKKIAHYEDNEMLGYARRHLNNAFFDAEVRAYKRRRIAAASGTA